MSWKDKQLEQFKVEWSSEKKDWIIFHTPMLDYGLSKEDFRKVQKRIGDFKI